MKKIWILTYGTEESFESDKILNTARANGLDAELLHPKYFDIIVNIAISNTCI